ncbi:MAG: 16S rRNA processing protein RimM [Bacteroidales bacterium]|nr:16S rRNA processing protein RimM [Bacteroidales bacterium]
MTKDECYQLGKVTKAFGYKGQMVLFLDVDTPEDYATLDSAFVEVKGNLVPHFFHIDSLTGNKAVVTFEELTPAEAQALAGCDLYLPLSLLPKLTGNKFYFHEVVGFRVVDDEKGDIGIVKNIIDYPAQPLFQIMKGETEILVPVIDPVIKKVDREGKTIFIAAPTGLIDLYLGE